MRTSSKPYPQELQGRSITFLRHNGKVHAVDSNCYHMGGPLGEGDIEELASGHLCITCPWHKYKVRPDSQYAALQNPWLLQRASHIRGPCLMLSQSVVHSCDAQNVLANCQVTDWGHRVPEAAPHRYMLPMNEAGYMRADKLGDRRTC